MHNHWHGGAPRPGPGRPWPLGVTPGPEGANVAVASAHAETVELCLFDPQGRVEIARLRLPERTDHVFHGFVPGFGPGQVYGFRAHGPWAPGRGHRFNPAKLLLDPYARRLRGRLRWAGPNLVDPADPFALDPRDTAPFVPKAVAAPPPPPASPGPGTPWGRTIAYEAHVKGLTQLHPEVPPACRGTYGALAHPALLDHLVRLGVTAVELLPVMAFLDERRLVERGLTNHWGYNPMAFLAAEPRYAAPRADPESEFRAMVEGLHGAGIEVILDVVLNHTAETDELGPTLSLRGLDNAAYYRLDASDPRRYANHSGCGNTLDLSRPPMLRLAMDALRHWAAMGVDGFRFDLGATLGRTRDGGFDAEAPLLQAIRQDPTLGRLKLVAEPWDLGPGGYRLGGFPPPFAEWNDRFRDAARRFWRGDEAVAPELAARLLGSAELFEAGGRKSFAGVNLIAAHDGFTALDLATYTGRRNVANGEGNRDGHGENFSTNCGVEGPSDDPAVQEARRRHVRNLLATLLLAQGTPMLAMGDEALRGQAGNNNAYCQDNRTSWYPWNGAGPAGARAMAAFVGRLARLRREHPALRREGFLHGHARDAYGWPDVLWADSAGRPTGPAFWQDPANRRLALLLNGRAPADGPEPGGVLLLLLNAGAGTASFVPPPVPNVAAWRPLLDTAAPDGAGAAAAPAGAALEVEGRALRLLLGA